MNMVTRTITFLLLIILSNSLGAQNSILSNANRDFGSLQLGAGIVLHLGVPIDLSITKTYKMARNGSSVEDRKRYCENYCEFSNFDFTIGIDEVTGFLYKTVVRSRRVSLYNDIKIGDTKDGVAAFYDGSSISMHKYNAVIAEDYPIFNATSKVFVKAEQYFFDDQGLVTRVQSELAPVEEWLDRNGRFGDISIRFRLRALFQSPLKGNSYLVPDGRVG